MINQDLIKVTDEKSKRSYNSYCFSAPANFFKQGTFFGIAFAEKITDRKFRVVFKHPETGEVFKTHSYTEVHPDNFAPLKYSKINSDIPEFKTCYLLEDKKIYYKEDNADIMNLPDHVIKIEEV